MRGEKIQDGLPCHKLVDLILSRLLKTTLSSQLMDNLILSH